MISSLVIALIIIILLPASSTLIPYTTLFRSDPGLRGTGHARLPSERLGKGTPQSLYRGGSGARSRRSQAELRSEEHTSELQSPYDIVCRLLLEKKKQSIHALHFPHHNRHADV